MTDMLLLTIIIALVYGAIGISSPLLTLYLSSLGANYGSIALILATGASVSLASNYQWGRTADALRWRKPLIAIGLGGLALAYLTLSQVTSPTVAWLVRMLEAASLAAYSTGSLALMGDLLAVGNRRGQRMGTYRGIGSLAFAAGAFIGGRVADASSLRTTFILCGLLYLVAALVALTLRESRGARPAVQTDAPVVRAPQPGFSVAAFTHRLAGLPVAFVAGVFLWTAAWQAQASMWPNYMASEGYTKTAISSLWAFAGLIEAPAMRLAGQWSDLVGRGALLAAGSASAAVVILAYIVLSRLLPALIGVQFVRGVSFGTYTANAMTFAVESADANTRGQTSGLFNTIGGVGQLAGLFLGGTMAQLAGFRVMFAVCALASLLSAICFWTLRRRSDAATRGPAYV